ncbi:MAG TPA: glycosyltransferase family 1 protein [Cytophagales bacterium]|nr:glycosyltransferase family 1 protein [Cytophagales bacterium]HAA19134.1 glycosyltransferase family 1 protein [Cytophagales bacterium]HAP62707.1 glycosyltransferase family 1 protein [Cytophagales bacterium]
MRVAIVLNTSWNIYNFRMSLVKALQDQGVDVHAVAPLDSYSSKLEEAGCSFHKVRMDSRGANPIKDAALIAELFLIYKRIKPDIILHYTIKPNIYGTIAARMAGIPMINNVCGLGTVFLKQNLVSWFAIQMYKVAFRYPKKIFFQNNDDRNLFLEKKLVTSSVVEVIPGSGINLQHFMPKWGRKQPVFTFLMISRLIYDKGVLEYVEAARMLREEGYKVNFQVLGAKDPLHKRGIALEIIDGWIQNEDIEYLGTTDDVRPYIDQADCIVLPSYREGTPRTLLEAASSGKPIVATNVPGCRNVVVDGYNGFLCELRSATDLRDKLEKMMQLGEEERETMGRNSRALVEEKFDEQIVIKQYQEAIDDLVIE